MRNRLYNLLIILLIVIMPLPALACAVCYTDNGMSGASIALIVIVLSFLIVKKFDFNLLLNTILVSSALYLFFITLREFFIKKYKRINILINHSHYKGNFKKLDPNNNFFSKLENYPSNEWKKTIDVNLNGMFYLTKHFLKLLIALSCSPHFM